MKKHAPGQTAQQIDSLVKENYPSVSREMRNHLITDRADACSQRFHLCESCCGCQYTGLCVFGGIQRQQMPQLWSPAVLQYCEDFERQICPKLTQPPYVCSGCADRRKCVLEKHVYKASAAQEEAVAVRSESRAETHLMPKAL